MRASSLSPFSFGMNHLILLSLISLSLADNIPRAAKWAAQPVGPDGPWNAVTASIGADSQPLALFPGHVWQTIVPTEGYCSKNASTSHCTAGTYSKDRAIAAKLKGVQFKPGIQDFMAGVRMKGKSMDTYLDNCDIVGSVPDCSLALVDDQMMEYPSGQWFPIFAGCLSVGAPSENQSYSQSPQPSINASIFPWYLTNHNSIPSSSFGMHIGSASSASPMSGSLNFGGFDKNRITGDILTLGGEPLAEVPLTDVSIKVIKGQSPFEFSEKPGLLASGNSSMPKSGIPVTLDGCSPYLTLPKSTCDSISTYLPVTYNDSLGLYLWNTKDPKFKHIMSSASTLSFSIMGSDNTKSITIKVPFQHLNLTIEPPLVSTPVSYFPCSTGGTGSYVLGRAFLQDAFIAGNWHKKTWWLAQAPGPNIPTPDVVSIDANDVSIRGSGNDWVASWDRVWSGLAASDGATPTPPVPTSTSTSDSGLTNAAKVGIGVGVGVGGSVLIGLCIIWFLWRKRQSRRQPAHGPDTEPVSQTYEPKYTSQTQRPVEVPGTTVRREQSERYELS
ncbi:hypothetical protein QQS21_009759 [Conoideocrella luteorostrata]|uniref:Peptidase A1 domain-containing protein n=1 Tax=Conoideocrella luteorostrata TaxID=1105319 RepID=A0AAJ0FUT2_9HYPO|nr:hypothetical protein QQS21_009759 [Conoideocrella luteorostrata]